MSVFVLSECATFVPVLALNELKIVADPCCLMNKLIPNLCHASVS